jgi:hypothetical protein
MLVAIMLRYNVASTTIALLPAQLRHVQTRYVSPPGYILQSPYT